MQSNIILPKLSVEPKLGTDPNNNMKSSQVGIEDDSSQEHADSK